mmetsp:Transcript_25985/g.50401  ORF Transcript_25985/g.50401 Transcript_25985/m.50401 type:complete len:242 (-) Transcript_25985:2717-3442(-)
MAKNYGTAATAGYTSDDASAHIHNHNHNHNQSSNQSNHHSRGRHETRNRPFRDREDEAHPKVKVVHRAEVEAKADRVQFPNDRLRRECWRCLRRRRLPFLRLFLRPFFVLPSTQTSLATTITTNTAPRPNHPPPPSPFTLINTDVANTIPLFNCTNENPIRLPTGEEEEDGGSFRDRVICARGRKRRNWYWAFWPRESETVAAEGESPKNRHHRCKGRRKAISRRPAMAGSGRMGEGLLRN